MRRSALAAAFAVLAVTAARAAESDIEIIRGPYLVADAQTGQVIEESDALRPWYPASTTKLMTIYTVFQAVRAGEISLNDEIEYSRNAAAQPPSKMGFRRDSTFTLDNALKMLMVKSANDVAVAVAEAVGGSVAGFASRMNELAAELGMTRSHFVNPHGLPDTRQVTSARDMALLARALLNDFGEYRPYYNIHAIQIGGKILRNYNRLVDRFPGTTGMKTGFICASGYNLVASAERGGRELIAVVFGAYGGKLRNEHAAALLDAAFDAPFRRVETETTLFNLKSGAHFASPLDMRPHVCGAERGAALAALQGENNDDGEVAESHLTARMDLGPPVTVRAYIPPRYGEPGYLARLPRARPRDENEPSVLNAFAPTDAAGVSGPAEAIGAAIGEAGSLEDVGDEPGAPLAALEQDDEGELARLPRPRPATE